MSEQIRIRNEMCEYIEQLLARPKLYVRTLSSLEECWMNILIITEIIDNKSGYQEKWQTLRVKQKLEQKLISSSKLSDEFLFKELIKTCKDFYDKEIKPL
jgi:hypothetical protein